MDREQRNRIKRIIRQGRYTSIGCYPVFLVTADGATLCPPCARKEFRCIVQAWNDEDRRGGWYVEAFDANWEDPNLHCDHCGERIESAYGEES